jgi:hypothetical protein
MALTWLGVEVQVYRTDARDADGDPLPRWSLTLSPLMPESDIVYGSTCRMTAKPDVSGEKPLVVQPC